MPAAQSPLLFLMQQASRPEMREKRNTKSKRFQLRSVSVADQLKACPARSSEHLQKMPRGHFLSDQPSVRPSVLSHSRESVGGDAPPLSQGAAQHRTVLHGTLLSPHLPAATSSPANMAEQEMLRGAPLASVTDRLLLDSLRPSSRI